MAQRIENGVDAAAALLLAGAVMYCATEFDLPVLLTTGWGVFSFLVCFWRLGLIGSPSDGFQLSDFARPAIQPDPPELLLDDVLTDIGEDPRVVRLFDPSAAPQAAPPHATQALYDALIELRRKFIQQS